MRINRQQKQESSDCLDYKNSNCNGETMREEELALFIEAHHYLDNDLEDRGGWRERAASRRCLRLENGEMS